MLMDNDNILLTIYWASQENQVTKKDMNLSDLVVNINYSFFITYSTLYTDLSLSP